MKHRKFFRGPLFIIKLVLILAITSAVVMLLWNALIPALFAGPVLTYWQAAGLLILTKIFFGAMGKGFGRHRSHHYADEMWKKKLKEKFESMSPEEQEKFRKRCRVKFSAMEFDEKDNPAEASDNKQKNP